MIRLNKLGENEDNLVFWQPTMTRPMAYAAASPATAVSVYLVVFDPATAGFLRRTSSKTCGVQQNIATSSTEYIPVRTLGSNPKWWFM